MHFTSIHQFYISKREKEKKDQIQEIELHQIKI